MSNFYTERQPEWLEWIAPESFEDKELFKIVTFYLFHCPSEKSSYMRKSLKDYGWNTPWRKPYKLNEQLKRATNNERLIYSSQTIKEMDKALEKAQLDKNFPNDTELEKICIYNCKKNQFESIFYHIRNAFAHCRLNMKEQNKECIFILEDGKPKNDKQFIVTARMIIKKSTLLKWMDIIENGEKKLEN